MPDSDTGKARDALLAKAAEAWREDPVLAEDDVSCFLDAYYQRMATEDLAPPSRLAAVAEAHARMGVNRPQGRALVEVREPGHAYLDPLTSSGLVVDIVTDDMPYLVDSVTTELNRHQAEIQMIVHPLLRVRRDVTGALRAPGGSGGAGSHPVSRGGLGGSVPPEETQTESWIHVELAPSKNRVDADQLAADLRHVLD
ncbi:MAG: hypothetical protein ACRDOB_28645, partial [Streptosporangiaceae bacterium]